MPSMSRTLRDAILNDPRTVTALARAADCDPGQVFRFVNGERTVTTATADRLCEALKLELTPKPQKRRKGN